MPMGQKVSCDSGLHLKKDMEGLCSLHPFYILVEHSWLRPSMTFAALLHLQRLKVHFPPDAWGLLNQAASNNIDGIWRNGVQRLCRTRPTPLHWMPIQAQSVQGAELTLSCGLPPTMHSMSDNDTTYMALLTQHLSDSFGSLGTEHQPQGSCSLHLLMAPVTIALLISWGPLHILHQSTQLAPPPTLICGQSILPPLGCLSFLQCPLLLPGRHHLQGRPARRMWMWTCTEVPHAGNGTLENTPLCPTHSTQAQWQGGQSFSSYIHI